MLFNLKQQIRNNPRRFYAMSIAATWAGAGSFIVGTRIARESGILPWLLWALGNTLCCAVFGLLADSFPKLRAVANSRPARLLMGLMCVFQIWVNMNGIHEMLSPVIGAAAAAAIVYAVSAFFVIFYWRRATLRNTATDNLSWLAVYALIAVLAGVSLAANGARPLKIGLEPEALRQNAWLCFTLSFGAFFYPTFWELLDYNEQSPDGLNRTDMRGAFASGGALFGAYLLFVLAGAFTEYLPALEPLKAVLVSLVAVSSLSSFLYGAMLDFGRRAGAAIDAAAIAAWQLVVPMGVMGVWTLMQNVRIWMVLAMFAAALAWHFAGRKGARAE